MSAGDPSMYASQGFNSNTPAFNNVSAADQSDAFRMASAAEAATSEASGDPQITASTESDADRALAARMQPGDGQQMVMADTAVDALNQGITQSQPAQGMANLYSAPANDPVAAEIATAEASQASAAQPSQAQAAEPQSGEQVQSAEATPQEPAAQPQVQELAVVAPPKKQSIFSRLFAAQPKSAKNAPTGTTKRLVSPKSAPVVVASAADSRNDALPGVRTSNVFSVGNDEDIDDGESGIGQIQLASAAGLARLAPNGLHLQTEKVEVGCFKPELVRVLKTIEHHYNRPLVVTSGYRSPKHNRRVGGASGSRHTSCEAADVQIEGVSKWQLAKYLRSMPGRGGVGTYCHTESVHIDIGTSRDWNWRCRRRK